jgi:hypothetical protein
MTAKPSPQEQEIIDLLKRLEAFEGQYPPDLIAARRAAFSAQIKEHKQVGVKEEFPSEAQVIEILKRLGAVAVPYPRELFADRRAAFLAHIEEKAEIGVEAGLPSETEVIEAVGSLKNTSADYPSELLAGRRAAFLSQIKQQKEIKAQEELPSKAQVIQLLESLKAVQIDYPTELLSARRAAFLAQIEERNRVEVAEELPVQDGNLISILDRLKSIEIEYPLKLWVARRTAFLAQVSRDSVSILDALRSAFRNLIDQLKTPQAPMRRLMRSSLILAGLLIAAFVGSVLYGNQGNTLINSPIAQENGPQAVVATATSGTAEVICKPGYSPPLCLAQEFDKAQDLTFAGNGSARPAVAKDTMPGFKDIHRASYVNDGLYGAGASWVSNSAYSWIKIDLGKSATINTITFGRDRLGNYNDRDPGQFVIAVALSDNIYADGNSANDFAEYKAVYDSRKTGFDGDVAGSETIEANFAPVEARFVKITFQNPGTAIDEVEAFMVQPPSYVSIPTKARENQPRPTWTPVPTDTLVPTSTWPPTLVPTWTPSPIPTDTPVLPTDTLVPTNTVPPTAVPTNTLPPTPIPTNTPRPTWTPSPVPTDTPVPPTNTAVPPTSTSIPPTDTSVPPTDTSVPPADTPAPFAPPTETPVVSLP